MATPTIVFNASTGSDTAASGAGPATALTGTAASYSGSVFTLDGSPDLSGVATDSTHVIYVQTSTGRKFFEITAVDNGADTVTVANAPAGTATGLTWAIGGKRATFDHTDSRLLFSADVKAGWTLRTETDQTLNTSVLTLITSLSGALVILEGSDSTTLRVINQTANASCIGDSKRFTVRDLKITNSNGTKTNAIGADVGDPDLPYHFQNVVFGDATNQLLKAYGIYGQPVLIRCVIRNCTGGLGSQSVSSRATWRNTQYIHNGGACDMPYIGGTYTGCLFADNTGAGLVSQAGGAGEVVSCTFADNTSHGLDTSSFAAAGGIQMDCIFADNGGYGAVRGGEPVANFCNTYYNNTSGARSGFSAGVGDNTTDPQFTNAAGGDWSVGDSMKAAGYRAGADQATTKSYTDRGGAQRQEAGSGGGAGPLIAGRLVA